MGSWSLKTQVIQQVTQQLQRQPSTLLASALEQALASLQRSGQLPLPPFAQLEKDELTSTLEKPLDDYQRFIASYPLPLAMQIQQLTTANKALSLKDGLADIRCNAAGECVRAIIQPSFIKPSDAIKHYHLAGYWPAHLFAQLRQPLETRIFGPGSQVCLPAINAETAKKLLLDLLEAYQTGMNALLPLARKTAFAALDEAGKPQQVYEGGYQMTGEIKGNPALQQFWPDYASLSNDPRFMALAELIYRPIMEAAL